MRYQPKYAELQDKSWLEQKYHKEKLSCTAISKIVGCHRTSVLTALRRYNIDRRSYAEATKLAPPGPRSSIFEVLNDQDWLFQKYVTEGMSTKQIAALTSARNPNTVRQALVRCKIKVRNIREGLIQDRADDGFVFTNYAQQVIEGGLLGDAFLRIFNKQSDICAPAFCRRNKFSDHVEFVRDVLGCNTDRVKSVEEKFNGRKYLIHRFGTLSHDCLIPIYRKWYPAENDYKKVVPESLVLTPTILLHWFLDDGSASWRNRKYPKGWKQRKKQVILTFSSESFTHEENQFLRDQMHDLFDIPCSVTPVNSGTGWRVKVLQAGVPAFFEVIGPCPVPNLTYKWKIP